MHEGEHATPVLTGDVGSFTQEREDAEHCGATNIVHELPITLQYQHGLIERRCVVTGARPVSYTHLTLPTICSV